MTAARDPEQAFVRRCGAELALMLQGLPAPPVGFTLRDPSRRDRTPDLTRPRVYTEPAHAGHELAGEITGLSTDLIQLIGGDQLNSTTILSVPAPPEAQPILRALPSGCDPVLRKPSRSSHHHTSASHGLRRLKTPIHKPMSQEPLDVLARLLHSRHNTIRPDQIDARTRRALDQLRADGIIDFYNNAFRASPVALYGSFAGPLPQFEPLTFMRDDLLTRGGNPTDKHPGLHIRDSTATARIRRSSLAVDIRPIIEH